MADKNSTGNSSGKSGLNCVLKILAIIGITLIVVPLLIGVFMPLFNISYGPEFIFVVTGLTLLIYVGVRRFIWKR